MLAAEGLAVVQPGTAPLRLRPGKGGENQESLPRGLLLDAMEANALAVSRWQTWAATVLASHAFANAHQRRVWELYSQATPTRDIPERLRQRRCDRRDGHGSSRASVERIIAAVNAAYPERPMNPWSSPVVKRTRDETLADYPPPVKLLPADEIAALAYQPPERKTTLMQRTYKYDLIMFNSARRIRVPGRDFANDRLSNVEGTPHAGGIDVIVAGKVITVSWASVSHCVREAETTAAVK